MAIGSIQSLTKAGASASSSAVTSLGSGKLDVGNDAVAQIRANDKVTLSNSERQKQSSLSSAIRSLSDLQTFVDTASHATDRVGEVLQGALQLTDKVAVEVDPTRRQKLADDAASLLTEIDTINSEAKTPSGKSVVAQGSTSYSFSLGNVDPTTGSSNSANSVTVSVPTVGIRQSDLGTDTITAATLQSNNTSDRDKITDAISSVSNISAGLSSVSTAISKTADEFATGRSDSAKLEDGQKAEDLASTISQAISSADIVKQAHNLDPSRVAALLTSPDEPPKKDENQSSASTLDQSSQAAP